MSEFEDAKSLVRAYYDALKQDPEAAMSTYCAPDLVWQGFHPFDDFSNAQEVATHFWKPLQAALRPMQRRLDLFFAGRNFIDDGASLWVASMGHLMGLFDGAWLGIRPTRKIAMLRYAAFHKVEDGRITHEAMYFDIPHLMQQAGQNPFGPQTAATLVQPGPLTHDGLYFQDVDPAEGAKTMAAINAMISDIAGWTGGDISGLEDELRRTWNEDMIWWGPAGIGATYTIERYAKQHAGPFRMAFRDRKFIGHVAKIAEGSYGGFFGRPNLSLRHEGGFMGMPATGQFGDMRVIDMYRRDGDKLSENWIFIDLLHFWKMQGVDILKRATGVQ
ncbi:nuclear transport factor 2 family protein [Yoonia litorea]|uniref:SnoaL-like domain-containing protein n=1 Tax=Yoonia litorea TaxID=1123755 RepID=A0A1I6LPS3_9RHOB|nr:nuclear transport factor 2 family protein [Yoonia litorea]SFS05280.1 SnoaL-like domain-containing protein [Yoonia litorea]